MLTLFPPLHYSPLSLFHRFAVLCKVGQVTLARNGSLLDLLNVDGLEETTANMSRFLLEFFVQDGGSGVMRPLTNSNIILDFYRYKDAPYFEIMTGYLKYLKRDVPDYELQYRYILDYFRTTKCLHKYSKFTLEGAMSSTPNTKALQYVSSTDDAVYKLARSDYYKYRAVNLMFGFNAGIVQGLDCFCEFNAFRKNQLLRFYEQLQFSLRGCSQALTKSKTSKKYRDYCACVPD